MQPETIMPNDLNAICPRLASATGANIDDDVCELPSLPGGDQVTIRPANGPLGAAGGLTGKLFEVTINGRVSYMTREQIENTNFQQSTAATVGTDPKPLQRHEAAPKQSSPSAIYAPVINGPRGTVGTPAADPVTAPRIVLISKDPMLSASAMEMSSRTGYPLTGFGKDALRGVNDVTLVGHANTQTFEGQSPQQLARTLWDAGWRGGTLRMGGCQTGLGCDANYAKSLVNELRALGAETTAIPPEGNVSWLGYDHGMPQVRYLSEATPEAAGEGWKYVTPDPLVSPALARGAAVASIGLSVLGVIGTIKFAHDFMNAPEYVDRGLVPANAKWIPRGAEDAFIKSGQLKEGDLFIMFAPNGGSAPEVYRVKDGKADATGFTWNPDKGAYVRVESDIV